MYKLLQLDLFMYRAITNGAAVVDSAEVNATRGSSMLLYSMALTTPSDKGER